MSASLVDLYTHYSARLAAHVSEALGTTGTDSDDVTQEVWLLATQLLVLPPRDEAWLVLKGLAARTLIRYAEAEHREVEILSGGLADVPNPAPETEPAAEPARTLTEFRIDLRTVEELEASRTRTTNNTTAVAICGTALAS